MIVNIQHPHTCECGRAESTRRELEYALVFIMTASRARESDSHVARNIHEFERCQIGCGCGYILHPLGIAQSVVLNSVYAFTLRLHPSQQDVASICTPAPATAL